MAESKPAICVHDDRCSPLKKAGCHAVHGLWKAGYITFKGTPNQSLDVFIGITKGLAALTVALYTAVAGWWKFTEGADVNPPPLIILAVLYIAAASTSKEVRDAVAARKGTTAERQEQRLSIKVGEFLHRLIYNGDEVDETTLGDDVAAAIYDAAAEIVGANDIFAVQIFRVSVAIIEDERGETRLQPSIGKRVGFRGQVTREKFPKKYQTEDPTSSVHRCIERTLNARPGHPSHLLVECIATERSRIPEKRQASNRSDAPKSGSSFTYPVIGLGEDDNGIIRFVVDVISMKPRRINRGRVEALSRQLVIYSTVLLGLAPETS